MPVPASPARPNTPPALSPQQKTFASRRPQLPAGGDGGPPRVRPDACGLVEVAGLRDALTALAHVVSAPAPERAIVTDGAAMIADGDRTREVVAAADRDRRRVGHARDRAGV